ncbi:MAG: 30S ribosomal protein S15 [Gammaproteobacteria bacterium]|nr:30S ribosomal protein S15 [Gammaproteobacteria bacterium]|tara:strand:- start:344 stop:613 length:270 start_codon:yes stop_codon:yes gene_type:complete
MTLTSEIKKEVIDKHQLSKEDTGSTNVQIALLTKKIDSLSDHFKIHKKDNHSRRGLLMMVNKRRKLLDYLKSKDLSSYKQLISNLGLRK